MKKVIWISATIIILSATCASAIRAGLDFTFIAHENDSAEKVTCDFCGYNYKKHKVRLVTLSASSKGGVVSIFFLPSEDPKSSDWGRIVYPQEAITSHENIFEIDYFQKAQVKEGQIVRLKGTSLQFELVDVFGSGCPPGARCALNTKASA